MSAAPSVLHYVGVLAVITIVLGLLGTMIADSYVNYTIRSHQAHVAGILRTCEDAP